MRARAGTEIFRLAGGDLVVPFHRPAGPEKRRFPTVLFLHGFPGSEKSVDVQRALLERGIASVAPHFQGSWGSRGLYRFSTLVAQARAALRAARRLSFVDGGRMGLYGFSMGGWTALNAAAEEPTLKAVVAVAPVGGPEMIERRTKQFLVSHARPLRTLAADALTADFGRALRRGDPAAAVGRIVAPVLFIHGDADETIPIGVSRRLFALHRGEAKFAVVRGAGHDFLERRKRVAALAVDWLVPRLRPAGAPAV